MNSSLKMIFSLAKVYPLVLLLCLSASAQLNCLKFKNASGALIGSPICRPLTLQAGTNVTFTQAANWTMVFDASNQASIGNIRLANTFPGADLGAQINAADADLGSIAGEIWATGGGAITTQISVSSKHVLHLFPATYTNALGLRLPVIRLNDNSSLIGEGIQTIVQESSNAANTTPVIVCAYDLGSQCNGLSPSTANIHISGIHFQGANPNAGTSLIDSVSLGNCKQCSVNDNWFDNIATSHILIGGTSGSGFWGDGFEISGNHFSGEANCSICVINGQNISIHDNFWSAHGNGAAATVDIEPNSATDHAQDIDIHNNVMDESLAVQSVYCVTIQNGPFVAMGRIKVHDNVCDGGPFTTFGNAGATGTFKLVTCFGSGPGSANTINDVEIYNNVCRVTVQDGISVGGTNRAWIRDNTVQCSNGYGVLLATGTTNAIVERNRVMTVSSCSQNSKGQYNSSSMAESGTGLASNIFRDNFANGVLLVGSASVNPSDNQLDGNGRTFRVGVGFTNSVVGSVVLASLAAPSSLQIASTATGSCVLSSSSYFWKVTAVDQLGFESAVSNELNVNMGGGFGCSNLTWSKVAGAASYNIYRGTSSGSEIKCANLADGSQLYPELGGESCSGAMPSAATPAVMNGLVVIPTETAPTCNAANRGRLTYTAGAGGVKDIVQVCAKDAADVYAYRAIY